MKMNLKIFKKGKPLFWIIGAVVIFAVFYFMVRKGARNSGASGGGNIVSYNQGPSDAQIMAASNISMAQLEANAMSNQSAVELAAIREQAGAAVAMAGMENQIYALSIAAEKDVATLGINTGRDIELAALSAAQATNAMQFEYTLESARVASQEAISLRAIDRAMFNDQLTSNREMLVIQADNMTKQSLIGQVGSLKKKDRDNTLQMLARDFSTGNNQVTPLTYSKDTFLGL